MSKLIVIGSGIVGLACAWAAQKEGWTITLVDRDFAGDRTSHGNAGGIGTSECLPLTLSGLGWKPLKWLADPLGPLSIRWQYVPRLLPWALQLQKVGKSQNYLRIATALNNLNQRALADFKEMMVDIGAADEVHEAGALLVYETEEAFQADQVSINLKRSLGVRLREVRKAELLELEPNLAPVFERALMIEDWCHVNDPKAIVDRLRATIESRGAKLVEATALRLDVSQKFPSVALENGSIITGDKVVVAAGVWATKLAASIGDRLLIESERGYNTTLPASAKLLNREVIFAEAMFVATPLTLGLRIGGAAEFAGIDAAPNFQRSDALLKLSRKYLPSADSTDQKQWMGHRPSTPDSLPIIGVSSKSDTVIYACGHGHLGLTQSATTAKLVSSILVNRLPEVDITPYAANRF